ncbi:conserved oligomeric Golgi complex subunit 8-like isoform X1 [Bolinopsis microptera]|uniref:conserved oligomeric Golgi complex subunit 8-like isoform X1 n=1 Tax=Bolinopsis microptera TaxID=2820187 RepID=UPI00307AA95D
MYRMSSHSRYQKFFADYFKDSWQNFEGFEEYFTNVICNLTSDKFSREKEKWEDEERRLLTEQKNLAFKHYQSFVSTAECSSDIRQSFDGLEVNLDSVIETVPELQDTLYKCSKLAVETNKMRKEANISISKHPQLLEILELPQLIDTSIRNSYFEEGLELHSFVNNLAVKYNDIPIIQMIKEDSDACIKHMEDILIKQLQGQITLAQCLKSVGLLRRIGTYTDTQLKVKFLQVRSEWFRGIIDNLNKGEIQYYMCKMIDSYRVNLFDIITQYRSVFIEDKATSLIFNSWLHKQVEYFLGILNENLPRCNGAILDSTLAQAMYFGMSLGRVGTDFRGALVPIFQQRILELCLKTIQKATDRFKRKCETLLDVAYHGEPTLVNLTPLAVYTNSIASMFNELRHCAPVSICLTVVQTLQTSLQTVIDLTVGIFKSKPKIAERFSTIIVLEMLPMIDSYLKSVFKTLPELYKHRSFSGKTYMDKNLLSLDLVALQDQLLPFLSSATKILLADKPFSVENGTSEETADTEDNAEIENETESGILGEESDDKLPDDEIEFPVSNDENKNVIEVAGNESERGVPDDEGDNIISDVDNENRNTVPDNEMTVSDIESERRVPENETVRDVASNESERGVPDDEGDNIISDIVNENEIIVSDNEREMTISDIEGQGRVPNSDSGTIGGESEDQVVVPDEGVENELESKTETENMDHNNETDLLESESRGDAQTDAVETTDVHESSKVEIASVIPDLPLETINNELETSDNVHSVELHSENLENDNTTFNANDRSEVSENRTAECIENVGDTISVEDEVVMSSDLVSSGDVRNIGLGE